MTNHGPKLNRDWIGLRVMLRHRARNQLGTIAEGTRGKITSFTNGRGMWFEAEPCNHCKCAFVVAGMHRSDFTILTPPDEWKDSRASRRKRAAKAAGGDDADKS